MSASSAIVIGGGVIGTACAHYLNEAGRQVTVLDKGGYGAGCSHGNCGLIALSHVLPLAEPGAVTKIMAMMFRSDSPFYVRPQIEWSLWKWFFEFARRCNEEQMYQDAEGIHALLQSSMSLYRELRQGSKVECEWESKGCLFVYRDQGALKAFADKERRIRDRFGVAGTLHDADSLLALEPALKPGVAAGAWHYEEDSHLRPDALMRSWKAMLESRGVAFVENCCVSGFRREGRTVLAARTDQGDVEGDSFIVATGAWTPFLNDALACKIPIQPGKGYSITMPRPRTCPTFPMIFQDSKVAVTPMASAYRLGSTMEFSGYDASLNRPRLNRLLQAAETYLEDPYVKPFEEEWCGWRPMTYDTLPVIDRSPLANNLTIAAGHGMLGMSMAPATGKLVSALVEESNPHLDLAPYSLSRFSR